MQYRKKTKRTQVLAYGGWDPEKRQAKAIFLGSYDHLAGTIPPELEASLTAEQLSELQDRIKDEQAKAKAERAFAELEKLAEKISWAATLIEGGEWKSSEEWERNIKASISELRTKMRLSKPRPKTKRRAATALNRTGDLDASPSAPEDPEGGRCDVDTTAASPSRPRCVAEKGNNHENNI